MKGYLRRNWFTLVIAALMIFVIISIPSQIKVSLVSQSTISPRLFPYFSSIGALICCVASLAIDGINAVRGKDKQEIQVKNENISYLRSALCIAVLLVWYLVLEHVGFIISTIVVVFILSYMLGNRNKVSLIVFPVVFTIVIYLVFSQLLHVNLPEVLF